MRSIQKNWQSTLKLSKRYDLVSYYCIYTILWYLSEIGIINRQINNQRWNWFASPVLPAVSYSNFVHIWARVSPEVSTMLGYKKAKVAAESTKKHKNMPPTPKYSIIYSVHKATKKTQNLKVNITHVRSCRISTQYTIQAAPNVRLITKIWPNNKITMTN